MKKIMFKDRYGLTKAVLEGRKTMTRRVEVKLTDGDKISVWGIDKKGRAYISNYLDADHTLDYYPMYQVGEVVAIAQSYRTVMCGSNLLSREKLNENGVDNNKYLRGLDNKMFTKPALMPHHIKITDIKVERVQDISDEDCLREGIMEGEFTNTWDRYYFDTWGDVPNHITFKTPREAYAALIDKVSGKGTWEKNPWVFAYSFERID